MSSVSFRTVGCRLNQAETAHIALTFEKAGYDLLSFDDKCDVYIIHSCTITKKAYRKSFLYARTIKKKHPDSIVVLAGCLVEAADAQSLHDPMIDIYANQKQKMHLPALIKQLNQATPESTIHSNTLPTVVQKTDLPVFNSTRALVKVQDGCDFCCSYCIVPKARGNPRSRPFTEIMHEVNMLAETGYREISLTGANLGRYQDEGRTIMHLLEALEKIDRIKRIRLSSIELSTIERHIIDYMADSEKLCHYLHIPLQSGDDTILKSMGRRYNVSEFSKIIEYASDKISLPGLGTDIISGFPGETKSQHNNTLSLVKSLPLNNFHIFPYSMRPGTKASSMPGHLSEAAKKARCEELIQTGNTKRKKFAKAYIGRKVTVLIEGLNKNGVTHGWTGEYLEAELTAKHLKRNNIATFIPGKVSNGTVLTT